MSASRPRTSTKRREKDARRRRAVRIAQRLIDQGAGRCEAARVAGAECGAHRDSVLNWMDRLAAENDPETPIDRRSTNRGRRPVAWTASGANDAYVSWCRDYLRLEKPGAAGCWRRTSDLAKARGWTIPNVKTFLRRLHDEYRRIDIVFARDGHIAALNLLPHLVRTVKDLRPLDIINGDGRKHDVFAVMPDGRVIRPVTWAWQDVRTRKILGARTGETENADLLRLAFIQVVDEAGVPREVLLDNTRAASTKWWSTKNNRRWRSDDEPFPGVMEQLGIGVRHTAIDRTASGKGVGRGRSKPVERFFRDIVEGIDKHPACEGAYVGNNVNAKPENYGERAIPWKDFLAVVREGIAEYNARTGRRMEAADGGSIDEAWDAEIETTPVRWLPAEKRALLLLAVESTQVRQDGTFALKAGKATGLPANRYYHESLTELARREPQNRKVVARFDPANLHDGVHVYNLEGEPLCFAECQVPAGFGDRDAARDVERSRKRQKRASKTVERERKHQEALIEDARRPEPARPAPPKKTPKVVELVKTDGFDEAAKRDAEREERELRFARGTLKLLDDMAG